MAIPIFRASVSSYPPLFDYLFTRLSTKNLIPKKSRSFSCASSELNPVQSRSELSFCVGTHLIPHSNKVERGGEDAFFVSSYNGGVIAVADGVSGLTMILRFSYKRHMLLPHLLVQLQCQMIFSSSPQEHYFDCPYQLSSETAGQTYLDAVALANRGHSHSLNSNFDSPYSMEAREKGYDVPLWKKILGKKLTGGKLDDITGIVGQVVSSGNDLMLLRSEESKVTITLLAG